MTLDPREPSAIRDLADAVSSPTDAAYGRHLDRAELAARVAIPAEERRAIVAWLETHGLAELADEGALGGQQMVFSVPEGALESALGAAAAHELKERTILPAPRCRQVLPRRLAGYVRCLEISGPRVRARISPLADASRSDVGASRGLTPAAIERAYGFDDAADGSGETIAILALGGVPRLDDLHGFFHAHGITPPEVHLVGIGPMGARAADALARFETTMAIAWAGALAPGARIAVYFIDPTLVADPWSAFLLAVISDAELAPTIAVTTWSCPERQYHRVHGGEVFRGLCDQAAAIGMTVIAASGDWGAYDGMPSTPARGARVCDAPWPRVSFPAAEERVLAVGGTRVCAVEPWQEMAWSAPVSPALREAIGMDMLAGGGGFSDHVPIPVWQRHTLSQRQARSQGAPAVVPYGRGIPDVALMAWGPEAAYSCLLDGAFRDDAGGTSTAAPIWAAIVARCNELRRQRGGGRLGFAQPLLYRLGEEAFRPITEGATDITLPVLDAGGAVRDHQLPGYVAHAGWSPAAGLGVPDVGKLVQLVCDGAAERSRPAG
ncbi:putative peptidase [Minicystis rosea]|nr:putative peptidase [Minicystis rosea]